MRTEAEIAWAAGLFEGEGTWGYQPNNVRAELAMTDHDTVRRFHGIVGVGRLAPKKTYAEHHQPQLVWRVTDRQGVQAVLGMFRPWLSDRRRERGEEILRIQGEIIAINDARRATYCRNGHLRTPENTHIQTRRSGPPYLRCRECGRERVAAMKVTQNVPAVESPESS